MHHRRWRAHRRRVRPAHRSGADVRERRRGHLGGLRLRLGLRLRRAPLLLRRCGGALRGALRRALRRALRGALRSCHDGTKDEFGSALGAILAVVSFFKYNGALTSSRAPLRRALRGRGGSVARALSRALTHARRSPRARARFTRHLWCPCHWRTPVTLDRKTWLGHQLHTVTGKGSARIGWKLVLATPRDTHAPRAGGVCAVSYTHLTLPTKA